MEPKATELRRALAQQRLRILGVTAPDPAFSPTEARALALIGPRDGGWWHYVTQAREWTDGGADPIDRWSRRVLGALAESFQGVALFPSDGPPWPPFFRWALDSATLWQSPVGMLVHAQAGLWVSFRGALVVPFAIAMKPAAKPCLTCATQPCRSACPVNALSPTAYEVEACHRWLDGAAGKDCLERGCAARRACPAGESHARLPRQSAYHMSQFHP